MRLTLSNHINIGDPFRWVGWSWVLCLVLVGCAGSKASVPVTPPSSPPTTEKPSDTGLEAFQVIGPGDLLEVIVRRGAGEERYAPTVREDGSVTVSFTEIFVDGLSPGQAATQIEVELAEIIRDPKVEVLLKKKAVSTYKVLVIGEIKKPGVYPLGRNHRVLQAIVDAEGATETALLEDVRIIRGELDEPIVLSVNIDQLLKEGDLSQNLQLQQNDIVFIPRTKIGDWNAFIEQIRPTLEVLVAMPLHTVFEVVLIQDAIND